LSLGRPILMCESSRLAPTAPQALVAGLALVDVHHREDELFLLLEGSLTVRCGEETVSAEPGSVTFLPTTARTGRSLGVIVRREGGRCLGVPGRGR
jgi:hypothetical protein